MMKNQDIKSSFILGAYLLNWGGGGFSLYVFTYE